jgi:cytochrome c heme-lyase
MKWNIGSTASTSSASTLPANHPAIHSTSRDAAGLSTPPAGCPMHESPPVIAPIIPRAKAAECPIPHDQRALHPLNRIPLGLSSTEKAPGQVLDLPTEREVSSIPRPQQAEDGEAILPEDRHNGKWEYPSPQQFYNALVRKGWETPEESIEMVVAIHNFLNERAWEEVMAWEKRLPG